MLLCSATLTVFSISLPISSLNRFTVADFLILYLFKSKWILDVTTRSLSSNLTTLFINHRKPDYLNCIYISEIIFSNRYPNMKNKLYTKAFANTPVMILFMIPLIKKHRITIPASFRKFIYAFLLFASE